MYYIYIYKLFAWFNIIFLKILCKFNIKKSESLERNYFLECRVKRVSYCSIIDSNQRIVDWGVCARQLSKV